MDLLIKNNDKEIIFSFGENWKKLDKEILWQYFKRALKRLNLNPEPEIKTFNIAKS